MSGVEKSSTNKKKYPTGKYREPTEFGDVHGKVFDRLGLDLLQVTDDGKAVVHADKEKFKQLMQRSGSLANLGAREQSRWATIEAFTVIPPELRVDTEWLQTLKADYFSEFVIELQPVLNAVEVDRVLRAIAALFAERKTGKLTGTGTDFSGRHWVRGQATQRAVRTIAKDFFSVQAIHAPLYSIAASISKTRIGSARPAAAASSKMPADPQTMPCVAVVDLGIPDDHQRLREFRRGQFIPQDAPRAPVGNHGSLVASRVVYGECESEDDLWHSPGSCTFYDARVGKYPDGTGIGRVDDKLVMEALTGVRGAAPDVRVFNLSIGDTRPLGAFPHVEQREKRLALRDLDNFVFANDCLVVVAAGNSKQGVIPNPAYPDHHQDPSWALGPWACGFNTLVCGSFVPRLTPNGLVAHVGWPSPFTRIGPGLCHAPIPSFGAAGGNTDDAYGSHPGLGVWGFSANGLPEDHIGTSQAAPILAREAALTLQRLSDFCVPGTQPFGVTARAFLTLTATPTTNDETIRVLAQRTLGNGRADVRRLTSPNAGSAVILWQGCIESPDDKVRVQLPIPLAWLAEAEKPVLRLVLCSDPPVNEAAHAKWACRRVKPVLHLSPDGPTVTAPRGGHQSFPVIDRPYKLDRYKPSGETPATEDLWLLELSYDEIAAYPPAMNFDPRQRVAFAAELLDVGESPADPQTAMQALPIAITMNRLSIQPVPIRSPIIVRAGFS
ncbi:MAG: S8 family serine peptidase [Planctomycetes bacterium]|nr:S8 family serine peptidase [Planctomycetota bacterium]